MTVHVGRFVIVVALAAALWAGATVTHGAPSTSFLLQPAEGGTKSRLSWTFGADWLSPSSVTSNGIVYLGTFAQSAIAPTFVSGTFPVSGAGFYNNVTTGSSFQIVNLQFLLINTNDLVIGLQRSGTGSMAPIGEQLSYTPGIDSYVVEVPFSQFVTGTYQMSNSVTVPANAQTLTISAVPEPSTCASLLAGLACGGYSIFRRRKRA